MIAVYLATTLTAAISSEEAFLRRTFGEQYDLYRSGVAAKRAIGCTAPFQPGAGDRESRVPRRHRAGDRDVVAPFEGKVYWVVLAGSRSTDAGRLAQW